MRGPDAAGIDYPQAVAILTARGLTGNGVQGFYYILDHTLEDNPIFDTLILRYKGPRAL